MNRRFWQHMYAGLWETPMWVFLWMGILILAGVLLVPPYLENRHLAWQRDLIQLQATRLAEQETGYREMQASLAQDDPVLLQRLAFHSLHLKPAGAKMLSSSRLGPGDVLFTGQGTNVQSRFITERAATVDQWLHQPMPIVGVDFPRYSRLDTFITRVASGPQRLIVAGAGCLCILFGLIPLSRIARKPAVAPVREMVRPALMPMVHKTEPRIAAPPTSDPLPTEIGRIEIKTQAAGNDGATEKPVAYAAPSGKVTLPAAATPEPLVQVAAPRPGDVQA